MHRRCRPGYPGVMTGRFRARSHCSRPGMTIGLPARIVRCGGQWLVFPGHAATNAAGQDREGRMAMTKSAATKSARTKSAKAKSSKAKSAARSVALKKSAPHKKAAASTSRVKAGSGKPRASASTERSEARASEAALRGQPPSRGRLQVPTGCGPMPSIAIWESPRAPTVLRVRMSSAWSGRATRMKSPSCISTASSFRWSTSCEAG